MAMDAAYAAAAASSSSPAVTHPFSMKWTSNSGYIPLMSSPFPASGPSAPQPPQRQPSACYSGGVSNCYVFKSRLQEYAQKAGIPTPAYETVKEGPSHEPIFKSTVIVNDIRYDSLPGFFNRKTAEQSAAEVALIEIHKSGQKTESIPLVHESGLCKNLLQEYAQKMNYAIPSYICKHGEGPNPFTCTIEIGGIQYIGAAARTKKESEIKAARTALLAIQSAFAVSSYGSSVYTVVPGKKKAETQPEAGNKLKPKKPNFKNKWSKKRFPRKKENQAGKLSEGESGPGNSENPSMLQSTDSIINKDCQGQQQLEGFIQNGNDEFGSSRDELGGTNKEMEKPSTGVNGSRQDAGQEESNNNCPGQAGLGMDTLASLKVES